MDNHLSFVSSKLTGIFCLIKNLISSIAPFLVKNPFPLESKVPSGELQIKYGRYLSSILIKNLLFSISILEVQHIYKSFEKIKEVE